ncbi:hypothetical protein [Rugamonas sp. DEMB1]|nr:hypothetical protein [Rugamonas sp. DEMB1]WGG48491.1 hypothetical protein QC826_17540 [Rugamonas sp. DEMB1]
MTALGSAVIEPAAILLSKAAPNKVEACGRPFVEPRLPALS